MKRLLWILAFVICAVGPRPAFALVSISSSSASAGPRAALYLYPHETLTYTETGTFTGTMALEKSVDGVNYVGLNISTTNNATGGTFTGTVINDDRGGYYRWNASTITAGSFFSVITQNDDLVGVFTNLRKQTILQLNDESMTVNGSVAASTMTFKVFESTAPRSSTVGVTPLWVPQFIWNSTDKEVCISTAANKFAWVEVSTPTTACKH